DSTLLLWPTATSVSTPAGPIGGTDRRDYVVCMTSVSETMAIAVQQHRSGRLDEAIALYRQVLTFDDANVVAYSNLGAALQQQGRLEEAADCYQRALAIAPDLVEAIGNLGTASMLQGSSDEAAGS